MGHRMYPLLAIPFSVHKKQISVNGGGATVMKTPAPGTVWDHQIQTTQTATETWMVQTTKYAMNLRLEQNATHAVTHL